MWHLREPNCHFRQTGINEAGCSRSHSLNSHYNCNVQTNPVGVVDTTHFPSPSRSRASSPGQIDGRHDGVRRAASVSVCRTASRVCIDDF